MKFVSIHSPTHYAVTVGISCLTFSFSLLTQSLLIESLPPRAHISDGNTEVKSHSIRDKIQYKNNGVQCAVRLTCELNYMDIRILMDPLTNPVMAL